MFVCDDYSCLLLSIFFFPPPLFSSSFLLGEKKKFCFLGGGEGKREALFIIDLQTCQRQSRPLWDKAKKAATLFPSFLSLLSGRGRSKEVRALLTFFFWQYHNRDWGSVFRRRTQTLEKNKKSFFSALDILSLCKKEGGIYAQHNFFKTFLFLCSRFETPDITHVTRHVRPVL